MSRGNQSSDVACINFIWHEKRWQRCGPTGLASSTRHGSGTAQLVDQVNGSLAVQYPSLGCPRLLPLASRDVPSIVCGPE